jgi:flagellar basal body-associated protein FliL
MLNQIFNRIKNHPKIILTTIIILLILAFVLTYFWKSRKEKFPPQENSSDEPNEPEENFSPPSVPAQAKKQTPPRDARGRFIKKVVSR